MELNNEPIYKASQSKVSTVVAYLIGAKEDMFSYYSGDSMDIIEKLKKNDDAIILRSLCNIRTNLMLHYQTTQESIYYFTNLDRQSYYEEDVKILRSKGIDIVKANCKVNSYIANINELIANRINNVKDFFPEWFKWEYIRELFVMPKGQKEDRIMAESKKFSANRNNYPYQRYIYWRPVEEGNILFNDEKFAMIIYRQHNEEFSDISKVTDASDVIKTDIYDFIQNGEKVMIVVDCENSDPIKLASTLTQLNADELSKISKIELYDDKHTSKAWKYIGTLTGIPVEHNVIERVKEEKSLVDIKMSVGISKAYFRDNVDSFIMLSSDSDFWGVISSIPDAKFLVMVEQSKCGPDILNAFKDNGTYYCYIDDFSTGNIKGFKNAILRSTLEEKVGYLVNIDTKELVNNIFRELYMEVDEAEKKNFYDKYVKKMTLAIDKDGMMTIKIPN